MDCDPAKVDDAVLALLLLGTSGKRAWRGLDAEVIDRLCAKGWLEAPDRNSPTLMFTDAGLHRAKEQFALLFGPAES
jgi:hypothetical protein